MQKLQKHSSLKHQEPLHYSVTPTQVKETPATQYLRAALKNGKDDKLVVKNVNSLSKTKRVYKNPVLNRKLQKNSSPIF